MSDAKHPTTNAHYTSDPRTDVVAKAIAWTDLSEVGRVECKWPQDFHDTEVLRYRLKAIAAMEALGV